MAQALVVKEGQFAQIRTDTLQANTLKTVSGSALTLATARALESAVPTVTTRTAHSIAYDSARKKIVMFGGADDSWDIVFNDTWEYDLIANQWEQKSPAHSPPVRAYASMLYDPVREVMVLYGGYQGSAWNTLSDTWTWDGADWTQVIGFTGDIPISLGGALMVWEPNNQYIYVYGGENIPVVPPSSTRRELYSLNVGTKVWTLLDAGTTGPLGRAWASGCWDPVENGLVIFGGMIVGDPSYTYTNDTWGWNGSWLLGQAAGVPNTWRPSVLVEPCMCYISPPPNTAPSSEVSGIFLIGGIGPDPGEVWKIGNGFPAVGWLKTNLTLEPSATNGTSLNGVVCPRGVIMTDTDFAGTFYQKTWALNAGYVAETVNMATTLTVAGSADFIAPHPFNHRTDDVGEVPINVGSAVAKENIQSHQLIYALNEGGVDKVALARADAETTTRVVGVATSGAAAGEVCKFTTLGTYSIIFDVAPPRSVVGLPVYLSNSEAGKATMTAPTTGYVVRVGYLSFAEGEPLGLGTNLVCRVALHIGDYTQI